MPKLHEALIRKLHPTQITVGMIEVHDKKKHLSAMEKHQRREFFHSHPIPAVIGPEGRLYITDHHHLGLAAWEDEDEKGFFFVEADFSKLEGESFWQEMGKNKWAHPYDEHGKIRPFAEIPKHLAHLRDDAYRSLAGYVRSAGGYEKTPTAFAEFVWADFFRQKVSIADDFDAAVKQALALSKSAEAMGLPGYKG